MELTPVMETCVRCGTTLVPAINTFGESSDLLVALHDGVTGPIHGSALCYGGTFHQTALDLLAGVRP